MPESASEGVSTLGGGVCSGGCLLLGVCLLLGGVCSWWCLLPGGLLRGGCLPQCMLGYHTHLPSRHPDCEQNDKQVQKYYLGHNFVAAGNNYILYRVLFIYRAFSLMPVCHIERFPFTLHPEGTSNGSDICDFSKNSDYNGCLWDINFYPLKII